MIKLSMEVFNLKECPKYAKYAFSCGGILTFSNEHPCILFVPGVEMSWTPHQLSKYKKCDSIKIYSDYIERLVLCRNGKDFESHEKQLKKMKKIDEMIN